MPIITIRETQATATGFVASLIFDDGEYQINITEPFTPKEERLLEWYFEEWLTYPMLNGVKAEAAKASVTSYGESLFNQVFDVGNLYQYTAPEYEKIRHTLTGSQRAVTITIQVLHQLGYADVNEWSPLLPSSPGEVISVLVRSIAV